MMKIIQKLNFLEINELMVHTRKDEITLRSNPFREASSAINFQGVDGPGMWLKFCTSIVL